MKKINIIIVNDHKLFKNLLTQAFRPFREITVVAEAESGKSAIQLAKKHKPHIVLMDISMPGLNGIVATQKLSDNIPDTKVIAVSMHSNRQFVIGMLSAGAKGYVLKSCSFDELIKAIRTVISCSTAVGLRKLKNSVRQGIELSRESGVVPTKLRGDLDGFYLLWMSYF